MEMNVTYQQEKQFLIYKSNREKKIGFSEGQYKEMGYKQMNFSPLPDQDMYSKNLHIKNSLIANNFRNYNHLSFTVIKL